MCGVQPRALAGLTRLKVNRMPAIDGFPYERFLHSCTKLETLYLGCSVSFTPDALRAVTGYLADTRLSSRIRHVTIESCVLSCDEGVHLLRAMQAHPRLERVTFCCLSLCPRSAHRPTMDVCTALSALLEHGTRIRVLHMSGVKLSFVSLATMLPTRVRPSITGFKLSHVVFVSSR